jgi:hypothetical protein
MDDVSPIPERFLTNPYFKRLYILRAKNVVAEREVPTFAKLLIMPAELA